jgi:GT2 family glycosyltransferase
VTHRRDPRFAWFADSLAGQLDDDVEVIVVDGLYDRAREEQFAQLVAERFTLRHVPTKPSAYNGPHRLTRRQYSSIASARNTGLVHATRPWLAFVDDCSVLMPGWLDEVRRAMREGYVAAGAYQKHWEMQVSAGRLVSSRSDPTGVDSRWDSGDDARAVLGAGNQLYGCSFTLPRSLLLDVNGFDELCDPCGGEDWQLGTRLEWAGGMVCYVRAMLTIESEEAHREGEPLWRRDPIVAPAVYAQALARFGVGQRPFPDRPRDRTNCFLDLLFALRPKRSLGNRHDLAQLRPEDLPATAADLPRTDWFDGVALADL